MIDKNAVNDKQELCEMCGKYKLIVALENHHIITKGAGGPDHKHNLITLCRECHTLAHAGKIDNTKLFKIISLRLKKHTVPNGVSFADGEMAWTSFDKVLRIANIPYTGIIGTENKIHPT